MKKIDLIIEDFAKAAAEEYKNHISKNKKEKFDDGKSI